MFWSDFLLMYAIGLLYLVYGMMVGEHLQPAAVI